MTTTTAPPDALLRRHQVLQDKDAALARLAALKANQKALYQAYCEATREMRVTAVTDPDLRAATDDEIGEALGVRASRVTQIRTEYREKAAN